MVSSWQGRLPRAGDLRQSRWLLASVSVALVTVLGLYALHAFSPLRIDSDTTEYLVIAAWIADGHGIPSDASFPPGLPLLIAGLETVGSARSSTIVMLNLVFLVTGLCAVASILRRDLGYSILGALAVCTATLLSFPFIRTSSHALSDVPFFGLALGAVALASASRRRGSYALFAGAVALTIAASSVRTIGFALVPMLFVALPTRRSRLGLAAAVTVAGAVLFLAVGPARYVSEATDEWGDGTFSVLGSHVWDLVGAVGELAINAPSQRVPDAITTLYPLLGILALVPIAAGAWLIRRRSPVAVAFLASMAAVLVIWPFVDSRLLLPTVPLLIACAVEAFTTGAPRLAFRAGVAWSVGFVACGIVVLAVSLQITFSGDRFPEEYNVNLRPTYRVAWGTAPLEPSSDVEPRALWALRRFEPRALGEPGPTPQP